MKRLWSAVKSNLSMICSASIAITGLIGLWISFWPSIITFALGIGSLILQYQDKKKHESEMALIGIRLQTSDIVAREVFDKPYYGGPVATQYPSVPTTRKPMKLSAPPVKRKVDE
jgi:hypothetical protein